MQGKNLKKSKRKLSNYTTTLPVKLLILAVIIVPSVLFLFPVLASIAGSFMTMTEIGKGIPKHLVAK